MLTPAQIKSVCETMSVGTANTQGLPHVNTIEQPAQMLEVLHCPDHNELESARACSKEGMAEKPRDVKWQDCNPKMDTGLHPSVGHPLGKDRDYTHGPEDVRRGLLDSLKALKVDKIEIFYLHGPDGRDSYEETLRTVNELHAEGYFDKFGISNYVAGEVAQMCEICERQGWIRPTVYEGHYHVLQRGVEDELFPCLHHYGISFYVYSPLAGGFLTGRYDRGQQIEDFHLSSSWNDGYYDALDIIQPVAQKLGLTMAEMALRWLVHHSELSQELSDAIIIGVESIGNLKSNLTDLRKGPLPEEAVRALDDAWLACKAHMPTCWR
ncbi:putative aldo keto reductase [Rosellinia necatrix]|uniref:Putative aldo keto reductase n=1 Tax=Rosellinia necatrix TaxID=77044 RepID=A0A1S7UM59_ROSNE|nr:putative aldo keto reductase [Rosellinia necatrix]